MMKRLQTQLISSLGCVLIAGALVVGCTSTSRQESTGQYIDSSSVTTQVKSKLLADPDVKSLPITVNTYKNQVQLSGYVETQAQANKAVSIAKSVPGVTLVRNDLVVR